MSRPRSYGRNWNIYEFEERYKRWWLGKKCRINGYGEFRKVVDVKLVGPPSFVYGDVWLHFEDGDSRAVYKGDAYRPRKRDVEVLNEAE